MSTLCKCGWRAEGLADAVAAEVAGDAHEARNMRRPHGHETTVVKECK